MESKIEQVRKILSGKIDCGRFYTWLSEKEVDYLLQQIDALYTSQQPVPCKYEDWDDTTEPAICHCMKTPTTNCSFVIDAVLQCSDYEPVSQQPVSEDLPNDLQTEIYLEKLVRADERKKAYREIGEWGNTGCCHNEEPDWTASTKKRECSICWQDKFIATLKSG